MPTTSDIKQFLETRLQAFDPTIDLSDGSPAQKEIIDPILGRFAVDPFSVDTRSFIKNVISQAFPDLGVDSGGAIDDILNAISLIFDPYRRSMEEIKLGQSVQNASLMNDTEAEALGANFFQDRSQGARATTTVRLYFSAPTTQRISVENRCLTSSGLAFYPIGGYSISADQMLFNRERDRYFMDIVVEAEEAGSKYNVDVGEISSIEGVPAVVRVANLSKISDGDERQANADYLSSIPNALSERSLGTSRGLVARVTEAFSGVRTLQVVGAGDDGMDRDILRGTGQGYLYMSGTGACFGDWIMLNKVMFLDAGPGGLYAPEVGDTIRFHSSNNDTDPVTGATEVLSAKIIDIIYPDPDVATPGLFIMDRRLSEAAIGGRFAIFKPGYITISETPGGVISSQNVPDNTIHVGGHVDVFVRPRADSESSAQVKASDAEPIIVLPDLTVIADPYDGTGIPTNLIRSDSTNFSLLPGDPKDWVLEIETGDGFVGSYAVLDIESHGDGGAYKHLRIDTLFTALTSPGIFLRGRLSTKVKIDLIAPKIQKYPFFGASATDLQIIVGSTTFRFGTDLQLYGVAIGDVIEILSGPAKGVYTIKSFDNVLGGRGPIVDRPAQVSGTNIPYTTYTLESGLVRPIVRIKQINVIDSSGQSSGIKIPYGEAIDARPISQFRGAGNAETIYDPDLLILPDCSSLHSLGTLTDSLIPEPVSDANKKDRRYSQKLISYKAPDIVRNMTAHVDNPITSLEYLLPAWLWDGKSNKVMAFTTKRDANFTVGGGINRTSDFASLRKGDTFTILSGTNQGSYVITEIHKYDFWRQWDTGDDSNPGHESIVIAQVYPPFKSDPYKTAIDVIDQGGSPVLATEKLKIFEYSTDWKHSSGFRALITNRLASIFASLGITRDASWWTSLIDSLSRVSYSVGPSARGLMRMYFLEPVTIELFNGAVPTIFESKISDRKFMVDPEMPPSQILPESDQYTDALTWLRNIETPEPGSLYLYARTGVSLASAGIKAGDVIEFHRPINDTIARKSMDSSWICVTKAGSNVVRLMYPPTAQVSNHVLFEEGQIIFIENGQDTGGYRITGIETQNWAASPPHITVKLDRPMKYTSAEYPSGVGHGFFTPTLDWAHVGAVPGPSTKKLYHPNFTTDNGFVAGAWVMIYAAAAGLTDSDVAYLGTYQLSGDASVEAGGTFDGVNYIPLTRTSDFPSTTSVELRWVLLPADPASAPTQTSGGGTTLSTQFIKFRAYDEVPNRGVVEELPWSDYNPLRTVSNKQLKLTSDSDAFVAMGGSFYGFKAPYRVLRDGVYRKTSTSMSANRELGLYYADIPVVGFGPNAEMNVLPGEPFSVGGKFEAEGYTLVAGNRIHTFSTKEELSVFLPRKILPAGFLPGQGKEISIPSNSVQIRYDMAPLVGDVQSFLDTPLDRQQAANMLARHFLPAYVYLQATYSGGSDPSVLASDLVNYIINLLPQANTITVNDVLGIIRRRQASVLSLPLEVMAVVHDTSRRLSCIRSETKIGQGETPVFDGTFRQVVFIPGPDTSTSVTQPDGEQINLKKI